MGRHLQLTRVIALLNAAAARQDNPQVTIENLHSGFEALTVTVDDEIRAWGRARLHHVADTTERFAAISVAMGQVKADVLRDLKDAPSDPAAFQRWCTAMTELYRDRRVRFATLLEQLQGF